MRQMLGMHRFPRPGLSGYPLKVLITCVLVAIVTVVRQLAVSVWDPALPFILFYPVVIVCAWMGGLLIGLLATGLSLVSLMLFLHTHTGIELGQSGSVLSALVTEGIIISFIFDRLLRKLERGYQQRLRHMQTFITEAPAAIAMFDRNMRYIAVSKRWLSDYHLEEQDLLGRSHYEVFPELPQRWKEVHQRCIAGAIERESEELLVRADGSKQWLAWEVRPWRGGADGKEIGGILIFSEDITAMKEAYEQEGAMRAKAEVATALQAEAEKLAKTKDDFVATLSHELRTPLNAMLGWTQLLKKFSNDPYRLVQAMNAIERSGQILTQLISDILDINRIASGKLRLNVSAVAVSSLMEHALNTVTPEIDIKGIALKKYLDVESLMVNCDPVRLQQCVWNLLSNAMKFTPRGGTITVSARAINNQLRISVADTGCGIPPETLPRIFERFVQADTSSTRTHGGLGLGLAIVRHLVELHGGSVSAHSEGVGKGSEFTILLPLTISTVAVPPLEAVGDALSRAPELHDRSFLVVDDQLEARELLRGALEDCGARVYTAPSAESGLALAARMKPDFLISDIAMPERDGCALIRDVRAAGLATPAIALSAHAAPADAQRALAAGFNRYLTKPVRLEQLFAAIRDLQ